MSIKERRLLESKANANLKSVRDNMRDAAERVDIIRKLNGLNDGNAHEFTTDRLAYDIKQSVAHSNECIENLSRVITEQQRGLFNAAAA